MTTTTFDTLTYFAKLKAAGVPEQQAKIQADAIHELFDEKLATKSDVLILQKDILAIEERLSYKLKELENKLTIRLGSMIGAAISILYVLLRFGH